MAGCHPERIVRWIELRRLPATKVDSRGGPTHVNSADVRRIMQENREREAKQRKCMVPEYAAREQALQPVYDWKVVCETATERFERTVTARNPVEAWAVFNDTMAAERARAKLGWSYPGPKAGTIEKIGEAV